MFVLTDQLQHVPFHQGGDTQLQQPEARLAQKLATRARLEAVQAEGGF